MRHGSRRSGSTDFMPFEKEPKARFLLGKSHSTALGPGYSTFKTALAAVKFEPSPCYAEALSKQGSIDLPKWIDLLHR